MTVRVIDKRNVQPRNLCLKHLGEGETFEFLDHNGRPYPGTPTPDKHTPVGICRVCYRNSRYLAKLKRPILDEIYIYNMDTGKIHRRNPETRVIRADVEIRILESGTLAPPVQSQD